MSKHLIKLLPVAAALALSGLSGFTHASTREEFPSVVVHYDDLNLSTKSGVAKLHARIRRAADTVCTPLSARALELHGQYRRCVTDAVAQGVDAVNNPSLSNFHQGRSKSLVVARN